MLVAGSASPCRHSHPLLGLFVILQARPAPRVPRSRAFLKDQRGSTGGKTSLRGFPRAAWDAKERWRGPGWHIDSRYLGPLQPGSASAL